MVFDGIWGQNPAVQILTRALSADRVHHAYRFEGPDGVGKELCAFALAQSLVCTEPGAVGCGQCSACHRAVTLAGEEPHVPLHPDVVLVGRAVYPKSLVGSKEASGISVEQIRRVVLSRAGYAPHEARSLVFIVRNTDELTLSAANALLKTLEEPHDRVHFVLLSSRPHRLLDTIRSRSLAVRFGPLPQDVIVRILEQRGLGTELAPLAHGSAREAVELADDELRQRIDQFAAEMRGALTAPDVRDALQLASELPADKHQLQNQLRAFGQLLALGGRERASRDERSTAESASQYECVQAALSALERNVSPTLAVETMLIDMRRGMV